MGDFSRVTAVTIARYLHGRFDPILRSPVFAAIRRSFEHRQWPIHDDDLLRSFGDGEIDFLTSHFSRLRCMQAVSASELRRQWKRVKFEQRNADIFGMEFSEFWTHLTVHFNGGLVGYPDLLVLAGVVRMILIDSSCCEQGFSRVNRTLTKQRGRMGLETLKSHLTIQMLGPDISEFDPSPIVEMWMKQPFDSKSSDGNAKGRFLGALMSKMEKAAIGPSD